MVVSLIEPTITYEEKIKIEEIDKNTDADIYETEVNDKPIQFTVGKIIKKYIDKNVIYYPIYLIENDKVVSQIGLYEKKYNTKNEEFNIDEFDEPLFFIRFKELIDEQAKHPIGQPKQSIGQAKQPIGQAKQPIGQANEVAPLQKKREKKPWIQTFMKDTRFDIVDTVGDGNCMFSTIEKGLASVDKFVSISEMRDILVSNVTPEIFNNYKMLYEDSEKEYKKVLDETKSLKKTFDDLELKIKNAKDRTEKMEMVKEAETILIKHTKQKRELEFAKEYNEEFLFMKEIDTIDKFKSLIKTNKFWGDTWAISTLEREINIKLMLFSEQSYLSRDDNNVFQCGQLNDDIKTFTPDYYIMTSYTGNHYQLITYDDVGAFTFDNLVESVKELVVDKCLERNAGPYFIIPEFKTLKAGAGSTTEHEKELHSDLYRGQTVFQIYEHASDFNAPGKGVGERLDKSETTHYKELRHDTSWRKVLSNEWLCEFTLDGHRWNSVEHYCLASIFKETDPEYYLKFSLDYVSKENNENDKHSKKKQIATNVETARKSVAFYLKENKNITEKKALTLTPSNKVIEDAIHAKFTKNKDLKEILSHTKNAKLVYFVPKSSPIPATILMKIRKTLLCV
jgi:predicted NAD-dependent protein-ADP-ribosyltransferase YbiA (DUF1768 family)